MAAGPKKTWEPSRHRAKPGWLRPGDAPPRDSPELYVFLELGSNLPYAAEQEGDPDAATKICEQPQRKAHKLFLNTKKVIKSRFSRYQVFKRYVGKNVRP